MLLPALSSAKKKAQGISCISNMKQLDLAWMLYYGEFNDLLPPNPTGAGQGVSSANPAWVAGSLAYTPNSTTDNTNTALLISPIYEQFGSIGGFTKNAGVYHCPGDQSADPVYGPRVRSCSMNDFVGPAGPAGSFGAGIKTSSYEYYLKSTDFRKLSPVNAFVFLDERATSIDDGFFFINYWQTGYNPNGTTTSVTINNLPAVCHNNCSSFSFADGHAEIHKWISPNFAGLQGMFQQTTYNAGQDGFNDAYWLISHATTK